jgi:16S rRNA A1518/A1519 N6-dimethyltransferase RsmA/KsgA/DIM1 with predicted DNA glycosylase/AP lyase activity
MVQLTIRLPDRLKKQKDAALSGVPFLSSPPQVVKRMLKLARVGPGDVVYDLGCGDGRILIAAVEDFKAKEAIGYEVRDDAYKRALEEIAKANLQERIRIVNNDFFEADLSRPSVITLYMDSLTNEKLKRKLEKETSPGTRIVSHDFPMPGWQPLIEDILPDHSHAIYMYVVPAAFSKKRVT